MPSFSKLINANSASMYDIPFKSYSSGYFVDNIMKEVMAFIEISLKHKNKNVKYYVVIFLYVRYTPKL